MTYAIIGSRDFKNYELLKHVLDKIPDITKITSGGAKGADTLAEKYANSENIPLLVFFPEWNKYGKVAALIRNKDIVDAADGVIAFWDGTSRGTKQAMDYAASKGKKVLLINYLTSV